MTNGQEAGDFASQAPSSKVFGLICRFAIFILLLLTNVSNLTPSYYQLAKSKRAARIAGMNTQTEVALLVLTLAVLLLVFLNFPIIVFCGLGIFSGLALTALFGRSEK